MKSDNTSKISDLSNQHTVFCGEESNNNSPPISQNAIRLKYADNTFTHHDISTLSCINPIFFAKIMNQKDKDIMLPPYITPSLLMEFLFIVKNGFNDLDESTNDNSTLILSLIQVSDFFQNESITIQLIREIVINKLNADNAFIYLQYSYEKLNKISIEGLESESVWFDLFYKCLETIGMNPFLLFKHKDIVDRLDSKVLYELLQKCFAHLMLGNYILIESDVTNSIESNMSNEIEGENYFESGNETTPLQSNHQHNPNVDINSLNDKGNIKGINANENEEIILMNIPHYQNSNESKANFTTLSNIEQLINYLYKVYQCDNNFFSLITYEYMTIFSNNSLKELNDSPNPTFEIQIPYDFYSNFYEEYFIDLTINNKRVILVIFYQQNDDSLNVSIKLGEKAQSDGKYCFQIFTFVSIIKLNDGYTLPNSTQTSLTSLSNNKSMHSVFKFPNFKSRFKHKVNHDSRNCVIPSSENYVINNDGVINHHQSFSNDNGNKNNNEANNLHGYNKGDYFSETDSEANDDNYFTMRIYLKLSFIHSVLASFLLQNFSVLAYQPQINKLSKQLFLLVIKNRYLNKKKEDDIVNAIISWVDDEINIKEDITEVIDIIQWKDVTEEILFVFIMKYAHMITIEQYEDKIIKSIEEKYNKVKVDRNNKDLISSFQSSFHLRQILFNVFNAAKRVDFNSLYTKMHKEMKMSMGHNSNNSNNTYKTNIGTNDMTSGASNEKKLTLSQNNECSSSKNIACNINNKTHITTYPNNNNIKNRYPDHLSKLYQSKNVNTINKFIICNNTQSKRNKRNKSPSAINTQMITVQSSSLSQFLANHTHQGNNESHSKSKKITHLNYLSLYNSENNNTAKKMSHLKHHSLQNQTNDTNGPGSNSTKKNIINLRTASNIKYKSPNDLNTSSNKIKRELINSKSFSKCHNDNTRNNRELQSFNSVNNYINNKTVIERDKRKDKDKQLPNVTLTNINQTNSPKKNKKINLFLKAKSSMVLKK